MAMTKYVNDVLTIISRDEITMKGIPYVESIIDKETRQKEDKDKWVTFWNKYFIKFQMSSNSFISCWNINGGDDSHNV